MPRALSKAQADGRAEAGKELAGAGEPAADALEDEMDDDEDGEGDECEGWPLVSDANQLLSAPLSIDVCSCLTGLTFGTSLAEQSESLQLI